jgi:steroid delta-isomerase-like uncharacterized protein
MATATTETRTPVEIITEVFTEVMNRRDADALLEYWAEDIVEEMPTGTLRGRAAVRDHFAGVFAALPDFKIETEHIFGEGEQVFVQWTITGTFSGEKWMGIEPTGTAIEINGMDCFTMRDGVAIHNAVRFDTADFARQLGMLPAQQSTADRGMTAAFNVWTKLKRRVRR